jgi:hypothetical protein
MTIVLRNARRLARHATLSYVTLAAAYVLLIFILPPSHTTMRLYHMTSLQYKTVLLLVSIPSLIVWLAAFMGYIRLRLYADSVSESEDGRHFSRLASGAAWLAWSLPVTALLILVLNGFANRWPAWHPASIIVGNYAVLLPVLIAFTMIGGAARSLLQSAQVRISLSATRLIMFFFAAAGVLYCYLVFRNLDLSSLGASQNPFFLPVWLLVVTLIVPYIYAWLVGVLAAYEITLFSNNAGGLLYRRALRLLAVGLVAVIAGSIALQYIGGVHPGASYLVLDGRLLAVTIFRLISGAGFLLLARGADKLKRIEEV